MGFKTLGKYDSPSQFHIQFARKGKPFCLEKKVGGITGDETLKQYLETNNFKTVEPPGGALIKKRA